MTGKAVVKDSQGNDVTAQFSVVTEDGMLTITRVPLTVTAKNKTINYGDAPAGNGVTCKGFVGSDKAASLGGKLAYSFNYKKNDNAGTYKITPSGLTSDNYQITFKPGRLTVKAGNRVVIATGIAKGEKAVAISWNKVTGATAYEVWLSKCGNENKPKKVKTLGSAKMTFTKKGLKKNTPYKFYVVAKNSSGKVISRSMMSHVLTGNVRGKYTNAKSLNVSTPSVKLTIGKTAGIKATQTKAVQGKKLCDHTALLRYRSSNTKVVTVSKNGKITAKAKGACRIYVQTVNGLWKTVKVTVQ